MLEIRGQPQSTVASDGDAAANQLVARQVQSIKKPFNLSKPMVSSDEDDKPVVPQ